MTSTTDLVIIGAVGGLAFGLLIALFAFLGFRWYKRRALRRCASDRSSTNLPIRTNGIDASSDLSAIVSGSVADKEDENCISNPQHSWWNHSSTSRIRSVSSIPRYSYKDIQKGTQNFTTVLGQGSFGPVYKAVMPAGEVVAVKVLAADSKQGEKEFQTEVSLLARLHHRSLVNLVGYCIDKGSRMLVYEFMSNGSLENLLYNDENKALSWDDRVQIALDISHGIEYLHDGAVPPVIHRDLKSANILLDGSLRAKVADFGLSKEQVFNGRPSGLKGTYAYTDPAYVNSNNLTTKTDVYSFGLILFELITAIHPQHNLLEYVNLAAMSPEGIDEIIDSKIVGKCNPEDVQKLAKIAHRCLHNVPRKRPSMGEISQAISKIRQSKMIKDGALSFASDDFSRAVSLIEHQQVELQRITTMNA